MRSLAIAGFLAALTACQSAPERPPAGAPPEVPSAPPAPASVAAATGEKARAAEPLAPRVEPAPEISPPPSIVTVQAEEPRYLPPESLRQFRYAKPPAGHAAPPPVAAKRGSPAPRPSPEAIRPPAMEAREASPPPARAAVPAEPAELPKAGVATVNAMPEAPRYKLPESLSHWNSGRKVPLYADPDAAPWQATPSEPRLQNAAVSCNYKDEGGVRGKAMLLVDDHRLTRFTARIEMPNGGVCQFDSKKMEQRPFEQGIALQSQGDECIVRMWEQGHRITIAAYSCHKQCSRGSFSYLWPIIMDTRVGTCY